MGRLISNRDRFEGAFLGFAIGDAFGYPARGMSFMHLCERFEKHGCLDLAVSKRSGYALFTDATQMMLFTADGIIWADRESKGREINYTSYVFNAYQLWLYTQTKTVAGKEYAWLFDESKNPYRSRVLMAKGMYKNRFVERTNIDALLAARDMNYGKLFSKINDNTDSYGLKRVLPAGLYFNFDTKIAFRAGLDFAAITHTTPTAFLSAGVYCAIIAELINGEALDNSVKKAMSILKQYDDHEAVLMALDLALSCYYDESLTPSEAIAKIGLGHEASEALAIAVLCALMHQDSFVHAIQLAVNHDGASDVCAALCGGILGTMYGISFIPKRWIKKIQYYNLIIDMEESLFDITVFNEYSPRQSGYPEASEDDDDGVDDDFEKFGNKAVDISGKYRSKSKNSPDEF